jgi:hypothetical protein
MGIVVIPRKILRQSWLLLKTFVVSGRSPVSSDVREALHTGDMQ